MFFRGASVFKSRLALFQRRVSWTVVGTSFGHLGPCWGYVGSSWGSRAAPGGPRINPRWPQEDYLYTYKKGTGPFLTDTESTPTPHSHPKMNPKVRQKNAETFENLKLCESGVGSISYRSNKACHFITTTTKPRIAHGPHL